MCENSKRLVKKGNNEVRSKLIQSDCMMWLELFNRFRYSF